MKSVRDIILMVITGTLAYLVMAVITTMLIGLFNPLVDNKEVFKIIGPAFQMVIGAFVGFFARDALEKVP